MDILFKRKKDLQLANNESKLKKEFRGNPRRSKLIRARLDELADVDDLAAMRSLPQAYCHELKGSRAGQLVVKLDTRALEWFLRSLMRPFRVSLTED